MLKKITQGFVILIVLVIGLIATTPLWLRFALAAGVQQMTGFPTTIEKTKLDLMKSKFGIYGLEIKNPKGLPKGRFVSVPEIYIDFDFGHFLKSRNLYFREMRLHVEEVGIIKTKSGDSN